MTIDSPLNTHFRRSQTPESPRPVHIPEPSTIPVLRHQMDPVFNDTATYTAQAEKLDVSASIKADVPTNESAALYKTFDLSDHNQQSASTIFPNAGVQPNALNIDGSAAADQGHQNPPTATASDPNGDTGGINPQAYIQLSNVMSGQAESTSNPQAAAQSVSITDGTAPTSSTAISHPYNELVGVVGSAGKDQAPIAHDTSKPDTDAHDDGVNFQTLLDNLSRSTSTAPPAESITAPTTATSQTDPNVVQSNDEKALPVAAGLPPRPPPQEKPSIHPNYSPNESIQSYHQMPATNANTPLYQSTQGSGNPNTYSNTSTLPPLPVQTGAPGTTPASALPPPPSLSTYQQVPPNINTQASPIAQSAREISAVDTPASGLGSMDGEDEDIRWGLDIQKKYDQFLQDERTYVTEGVWDRFPPGSRLFVGNLPTEKVTKRDLFHIFHKHGKLAQISIKQAYGFVQFLDASACYEALDREQGVAIRGRKIHLEVSKPQKNSRNSGPAEHLKQNNRRRSRSPGRRGGGRHGNDRNSNNNRVPFSDFRDEPARRRDDYRPVRSPSPRGHDGRNSYRVRDRSPGRYGSWDDRGRSPVYVKSDARYGSPPPRPTGYDSDADLPIPRRHPQDVPDVQILILEEVDRNFVFYVENGFRSKTLRSEVLTLSPRITLQAVIKRQVLEGVQAVVKLNRLAQLSGKIALQVFDRSSGAENVNFNEYEGLDVNVAADIVIHSKRLQAQHVTAAAQYTPSPTTPYGTSSQFSLPNTSSYPSQPSQSAGQPNVANMISNLDGASLQKLLGTLQQPHGQRPAPISQQAPAPNPSAQSAPDLASLLSNVARQQHQNPGVQPSSQPQSHGNGYAYGSQPSNQSYNTGWSPPPGGGNAAVQNLMNQLSRYR